MSRRKRPAWIYLSLAVLLLLLVLSLWLSGEAPDQQQMPMISTSPPVVFEDVERMASVQELEPVLPGGQGVSQSLQDKPLPRRGMALILDDVGYDLKALRRALAFELPMAVAVLPNAPFARKAAELVHEAGLPVMLHMPMEPANPRYQQLMDASFIRVGMARDEVRDMMLRALKRVPFVEGMNNHMGSRLTALAEPMRWVMQVCREQKLFFIDSRTNKDSVAARLAHETGLRWAERRVFLDDSIEPGKLMASWKRAKKRMAKDGYVIIIAHPHKESLDFLERHVNGEDRAVMVPITRLLMPSSRSGSSDHGGTSGR